MEKKIIAVTGATGFVGRNLIPQLEKENFEVRLLVRNSKSANLSENCIIGDLETGEGLEQLLTSADIVVNLAGRIEQPFNDLVRMNAAAVYNLCDMSVRAGVKKLIHISTAAVYGLPTNEKPFTEEDKLEPNTPYGLSKLLGEEILSYYQRNVQLPVIILRPPNIYGPGSDHGVVYNLIKSEKETGGLTIHGQGTQQRDFLYVDDLITAIIKCFDYDNSNIFNVTTSDPKDLNEFARILGKVTQKDLSITYQGEVQGVKFLSASNEKAKRLLDWEPKITLEEGLKQTLKSF